MVLAVHASRARATPDECGGWLMFASSHMTSAIDASAAPVPNAVALPYRSHSTPNMTLAGKVSTPTVR